MKIIDENMTLRNFEAWGNAKRTQETIIENGCAEDFDNLIEELFPDGISSTQLNDILWFDSEWVFDSLGIEYE